MSKSGGFGDFSFQFPVKGELESVRGLSSTMRQCEKQIFY